MLRLPAAPNVQGLDALRTIPQGGYEVYEDVLYDTVTYPAAGVGAGGSLLFFTSQANTADATLTNLRQPGQLPAPQFFYARAAFLEPLIETSIGNTVLTAAGRSQDLDRLMFTAATTRRPRAWARCSNRLRITLTAVGLSIWSSSGASRSHGPRRSGQLPRSPRISRCGSCSLAGAT
jgi:hypothetical protein